MEDIPYGFVFIGLAFAYGVQLYLTGLQAKRYFKRLKVLRKAGLTSVGMAGGKWSGRVYGGWLSTQNLRSCMLKRCLE